MRTRWMSHGCRRTLASYATLSCSLFLLTLLVFYKYFLLWGTVSTPVINYYTHLWLCIHVISGQARHIPWSGRAQGSQPSTCAVGAVVS